jgi:uncharacterized protein (TIGR02117 family)
VKVYLRAAGLAGAALLLALALYIALALVLGAIPRNTGFVESGDGVAVYVRTNGVHAELILPVRHGDVDWSAEFPARHMRSLTAPTEWIAFGWGDRAFMIDTPTWADIHPTTAIVALAGLGEGAMHVEYVETPAAYKARRVRLAPEEYARLVAYIRGSFVRDPDGSVRQIDAPGYFDTDAFYEAVPTYTFWHTCNEWTRRALAAAGVRTALWAPFDTAVLWHLPPAQR